MSQERYIENYEIRELSHANGVVNRAAMLYKVGELSYKQALEYAVIELARVLKRTQIDLDNCRLRQL